MQEDNINTFLQPSNSISSLPKADVNRPDFLKEQDRFLPIANVSKIMKKDIPLTAKIAKEAKECIQECASEFISFISSEAAEICQIDKRKTINGEDILQALASLGFEKYVDPLQKYLQHYRELNKFENGLIDMNTCCNADKHWSILSSTKLNYNFGNVKLSMPKLLSMLPLTDLTSNNLNLESLLQDSDFQRAVLNHLKIQSTDEDSFNIEEGL